MTPEQLNEAIRQKRMMEELMQHPGYAVLKSFGQNQALQRKNQVLLQPTEQPLTQEYMKGEISGIELIFKLPEAVIESAQAVIAADMGKNAEESD